MSVLCALSSSVERITRTSQPCFCQVMRTPSEVMEGVAFKAWQAQGGGPLHCLLSSLCVGGCLVARLVDAGASKSKSISRARASVRLMAPIALPSSPPRTFQTRLVIKARETASIINAVIPQSCSSIFLLINSSGPSTITLEYLKTLFLRQKSRDFFFFNITYLLKLLHFLSACRGTSASGNTRLYLDTSDADDSSITSFFFSFLQRQKRQCWSNVYTLGSACNFT